MPDFFQEFYNYSVFEPYVEHLPEYQALFAQWREAVAALPDELQKTLAAISMRQIALTGAMSYLRGLSSGL